MLILVRRTGSHRNLVFVAFLACFLFITVRSCGALSASAGQELPLVSLDASSQDIKAVLAALAEMAGVDIVVDDTLTARVTLRLSDVPFEQAMDTVARAGGATVVHEDGPYLVLNSRSYYQAPSSPS